MKVKSSHMRVRSVTINIKTVNGSNVCPFTQRLPGTCQGRRKGPLSSPGGLEHCTSRDLWGFSPGAVCILTQIPCPRQWQTLTRV